MRNKSYYGNLCSLFYDASNGFACEQEVAFYEKHISAHGKVLEAMCGSGRLLIPLLERGHSVDGVDASSAMLARCHERCAALQLKPMVYEQSLETLVLASRYQTVIIALGSFQLITDRVVAVQILQNLHAHMDQGGDLFIDIFVPEVTSTELATRELPVADGSIIRLTTRYVINEQTKIADALCEYERVVSGQITAQEHELIRVTWYSDAELRMLLEDAHFELIAIYDEPFGLDVAARVVHARAL